MAAKHDHEQELLAEWEAARRAEHKAGDALAETFDIFCLGDETLDAVVAAIEHRQIAMERCVAALQRLQKHGS